MRFIKKCKTIISLISNCIRSIKFAGGSHKPEVFDTKLADPGNNTYALSSTRKAIHQTEHRVIVLLHGLNSPHSIRIENLANQLQADLKDAEIVILRRNISTTAPMSGQAKAACQELTEALDQRGLFTQKLLLIGDSQGGLLALELYNLYKAYLHIIGIITNHSPLEGAPIADRNPDHINRLRQITDVLEMAKVGLKLARPHINFQVPDFLNLCKKECISIEDLKPHSTFIEEIKKTLETASIPILALGGKIPTLPGLMTLSYGSDQLQQQLPNQVALFNLLQTIDLIRQPIQDLDTIINKIIGDKVNDCLVPLPSQVASNTLTPPTFERFVVEGYHHFGDIVQERLAYNKIVAFINNCFKALNS